MLHVSNDVSVKKKRRHEVTLEEWTFSLGAGVRCNKGQNLPPHLHSELLRVRTGCPNSPSSPRMYTWPTD